MPLLGAFVMLKDHHPLSGPAAAAPAAGNAAAPSEQSAWEKLKAFDYVGSLLSMGQPLESFDNNC